MKKLDRQFFQSILVVLLSLAIFLIIIASFVKIDEIKRLSYKVDTNFVNTDIIRLNNKLPISDEIGKNYTGKGMDNSVEGYSVFTVSNPNDKKVSFEIYLTKIDTDKDLIKSNYIKLYLTDDKSNPVEGFEKNKVKSYHDLYSLSDKPGSSLLYRGTLVAGSTKKFILRSWLADTYAINKNEEVFAYDIDVRIK